jgi:hypothetical protein
MVLTIYSVLRGIVRSSIGDLSVACNPGGPIGC